MAELPRARVRTRTSSSTSLTSVTDPRALRLSVTYVPIGHIKRASRQLRRRGRDQVGRIAANIRRCGCLLPLPTTRDLELIDGHGVLDALNELAYETVPVVIIDHLSPAEVRALRLSLNKLAEQSSWDPDVLAEELADLFKIDPDLVAFTGFTMPELDACLAGFGQDPDAPDPADAVVDAAGPVVSRHGDHWLFEGGHGLLCASARAPGSYPTLLGSRCAQMVCSDPPYGGHERGHPRRSHRAFVEGSGLDEAGAQAFFLGFLTPLVAHLQDGAIVDLFIDGPGLHPLGAAVREVGLAPQVICVWDKGAGGMGSLYRHQVEFVIVAKWGKARHINNVMLGKHGRNRTTVWQAPGLAQFGAGRDAALAMHPTVKPVGLVADALLDTSHPGGIVLDPFLGSGTTLLAAHRTRRIGCGIELDPAYVDVAVRRMERETGAPARHAGTGLTFAGIAEQRRAEADPLSVGVNLLAPEMA